MSRHGFLKVKVHTFFIHVSSEHRGTHETWNHIGGYEENVLKAKILPDIEGGGEPVLRAKVDGGWCLIAQ